MIQNREIKIQNAAAKFENSEMMIQNSVAKFQKQRMFLKIEHQ
jgi:hypothetical protein